jgi:2-amino-4,5-dihydroxy-6-oxo-7-(phosphooxy)heptanoate synthase
MSTTRLTGKALRISRLSRHNDNRFMFIPLDHSFSEGPIAANSGFSELVREIVAGGADGLIVHKGRARTLPVEVLNRCALIVHLSASTRHAPEANDKVLVGDVEDALRIGADAVSVHINIGSHTEKEQLADVGAIASACDRWGMPLIAMVYPRGPRISDPSNPSTLAHVVNIAADLGADVVKTVLASPAERMSEVIASSPLPVIVAGGAVGEQDLLDFARSSISAGCDGLAVGRRIFTQLNPRHVVQDLVTIVHGDQFLSMTADPQEKVGIL